ncbi:MAG: GvpL/GvpF family gas vesicle protein [bacterium]
MNDPLLFFYCITGEPCSPTDLPDGVRCLGFGTLYAIAKDVSSDEFSEENLIKNFGDLEWVEKHVREHISTISRIMAHHTVIPFKFGTIFNSEENLGKFISEYSDSLHENIIHVTGKEEWSVKIYSNREVLTKMINGFSMELLNMEQEMEKSTPGKAFILKRRRAELMDKEIERVIRNCGQTCFDGLARHSEETRINNLLPREVTEHPDDMILNAVFFIKKQHVEEFLKSVGEGREKYGSGGFSLEVTGPWPPFNFISIKEK